MLVFSSGTSRLLFCGGYLLLADYTDLSVTSVNCRYSVCIARVLARILVEKGGKFGYSFTYHTLLA